MEKIKRHQLQILEGTKSKPKRFNITSGGANKLDKEITGDIWKFVGKSSVICIPTNNFVTNGKNVMGAGLAKEFATRYKNVETIIGGEINKYGFFPFAITIDRGTHIFSFPTKPDFVIVNENKSNIVSHAKTKYNVGDKVPGFHSIGCLKTIRESAKYFNILVETFGERWHTIIIPKLGTGYGELLWEDVKKVLKEENLYDKPNVHFISK